MKMQFISFIAVALYAFSLPLSSASKPVLIDSMPILKAEVFSMAYIHHAGETNALHNREDIVKQAALVIKNYDMHFKINDSYVAGDWIKSIGVVGGSPISCDDFSSLKHVINVVKTNRKTRVFYSDGMLILDPSLWTCSALIKNSSSVSDIY